MQAGRPPYVKYEERSFEDRAATQAEGRLIMRSVDFVIIRQTGSKDTVETEAKPWLDSLKNQKEMHPDWISHFHKQFDAYKSGQEITPIGTHVKTWPLISKAQCDMLLNANLRTVEDVAGANEDSLRNVGIGARELQQKARAWLDNAQANGKGAEKMVSLQVTVDDQTNQIAALTKLVNELKVTIIKQAGSKKVVTDDDFLGDGEQA
jgi:hypothetical protein